MSLKEELEKFLAQFEKDVPEEVRNIITTESKRLAQSGIADQSLKVGDKAPTVVRVVSGENKFRRGSEDDVTKGSKVMAIVNLSSVWFASKMFGVSLSVDQMVVWPACGTGLEAFAGMEDFEEE